MRIWAESELEAETQDGVNENLSNEESWVVLAKFQQDLSHQENNSAGVLDVKNTNIEEKTVVASTDSTTEREEDCHIFVGDLNTHDQSFELDAIDQQLMDLNLSSGTVNSSVTQRKRKENDNVDSSLDEFIGSESSDISSTSHTEDTNSSIIILKDDASMSDATTTGGNIVPNSIVDTDDNVSNISSAIPPSVVESNDESDKTVPFSDGDALSDEITIKMTSNVVSPSQDESTDDFSEDEIEGKLMLIRSFPNEIKKTQASYYGGKRVGSYPTCIKKKIHNVNNVIEIHQKSVKMNESEEVNKTDGIEQFMQKGPDEEELDNSDNDNVNENMEPDFPHEDIHEEEQENIENNSASVDLELDFLQKSPDKEEQDKSDNDSASKNLEPEFPQKKSPDEEEQENIGNNSASVDLESELPKKSIEICNKSVQPEQQNTDNQRNCDNVESVPPEQQNTDDQKNCDNGDSDPEMIPQTHEEMDQEKNDDH